MKIRGYRYDGLVFAAALIVALGFAAYTALSDNYNLALCECAAVLAVVVLFLIRALFARRRYRRMLYIAAKKADHTDTKVLESFSYPVCIADEDSLVTWCNKAFADEVAGDELNQSYSVKRFLGSADPEAGDVCVSVGDKYFNVYSFPFHRDGRNYTVYELTDNTRLKKTEEEYIKSRPYSIIIDVDNIDNSRSDIKDSEKSAIISRVEAMIDEWSEKFSSSVRRISDDRYSIITEKENIDAMAEDKFSIIGKVRDFTYKDRNAGVTLSIGVAPGETIMLAEKAARKAFDIAIGRGGDQAALLMPDGSYTFFGGVSSSAEKYSKTQTRVLAGNLAADLRNSSSVFVMGHAFSDFDSLGGALGVAVMARALGVPAYVVVNKETTLALSLVDFIETSELFDIFMPAEKAMRSAGRKSLAVLVDTHIVSMSDYPELFEKCESHMIIDHHRLAAGNYDSDIKIYHSPTASSSCEMITEYISYTLDYSKVSASLSQALLSGIMLDTKNFVIRSGARTFSAAAYLKERGANLVETKKLFNSSFDDIKLKNSVVDSAEFYKNCAVARVPDNIPDSRLIAAKAADDLLGVSGVKASFVLYESSGAVSISARSLGEINVQLIMESLGGGGHRTMAAARLETSVQEAEKMLYEAIDKMTESER